MRRRVFFAQGRELVNGSLVSRARLHVNDVRVGAIGRGACLNERSWQAVQGDVLKSEKRSPARALAKKSTAAPGPEGQMGEALRSVYDKAVQEAVPDDLLDLLSKLD